MQGTLVDATRRFLTAISPLTDEQMSAPSRLPNWSRGHVATHIARNADAMVNLCVWASTGVQSPMYRSQEERDSQIESGARRSANEIVTDVSDSAERLDVAIEALSDSALRFLIRRGPAAAGPLSPASDIPWMRKKEVEIHLVDLDLAPTFADTPLEFLATLLTEEVLIFDSRMLGLTLITDEGPVFKIGDGVQRITGSTGDITAWLLGRANEIEISRLSSDTAIATPPSWL
jgi:maleylpyruvate isomerase